MDAEPGSLQHVIAYQKRYNGVPDGKTSDEVSTDDYADLGEVAKEQGIEDGGDE